MALLYCPWSQGDDSQTEKRYSSAAIANTQNPCPKKCPARETCRQESCQHIAPRGVGFHS